MAPEIVQFLGLSAAFVFLTLSIFVTMGYFGGRKLAPPLSFYSLSRELGFDDLAAISMAIAKKRIKSWNQFIFGPPYIVAERVIKSGNGYSYIAVPKGFESDFQGYMLLRGMKFFKVDTPVPIEAETILVSDFSFKSMGSLSKLSLLAEPAISFGYGGAVIQLILRGKQEGGIELNSRLAAFGDDYEAKRLFYALSRNPGARSGSPKLEAAVSLRLFREKNAEKFNF